MRTRRGSDLWSTFAGDGMVHQFNIGDVVKPVIVEDLFFGVVREVSAKCNKILVAWGGGSLSQHDPDELMVVPWQESIKIASDRREATSTPPFALADETADSKSAITGGRSRRVSADPPPDQYVGNPDVHGLDKPRGGGFSIMQNLQKDLAPEALAESEEGPKISDPVTEDMKKMDNAGGDQNAPSGEQNAPQIASEGMESRRGSHVAANSLDRAGIKRAIKDWEVSRWDDGDEFILTPYPKTRDDWKEVRIEGSFPRDNKVGVTPKWNVYMSVWKNGAWKAVNTSAKKFDGDDVKGMLAYLKKMAKKSKTAANEDFQEFKWRNKPLAAYEKYENGGHVRAEFKVTGPFDKSQAGNAKPGSLAYSMMVDVKQTYPDSSNAAGKTSKRSYGYDLSGKSMNSAKTVETALKKELEKHVVHQVGQKYDSNQWAKSGKKLKEEQKGGTLTSVAGGLIDDLIAEIKKAPKTAGLRSRRALSVPERHQKAIALKTLKMTDAGAKVMGGMNKEEARAFLKKIGYSDSKIRRLESSDKTAAGSTVTKKQWEKALKEDEKMLNSYKKMRNDLKHGEPVENANLQEVEVVISGLMQVISNKKNLIRSLAASKRVVAKKKNLRTTVEDNHGNTFVAWLEDKPEGAVLVLQEKTGSTFGKWSWYVDTLMGTGQYSRGRIGDEIALDAGQNWSVTGMKKLMDEVEKSIKVSSFVASETLRSRRAMYWSEPGRVYRLTKQEQNGGVPTCPKCRNEMEKQPFTKSEKLVNCPECGFKIPASKVKTERKVEIEVGPDGSVEVEIEPTE